jgi:LysM repeat protein
MIKLLVLIGASFLQPQAEKDSIGVETINGKVFVIHKVGEKETLYALSKRYGTTVDAIVKQNPTAASGLEIGQILKVPYTAPVKPKQQTSGGIIHVVAAGETMFSISKAYNVSVDEIKQWNTLPSNALSVGQELVIKRKNTTTTSAPTTPRTESVPPATSRKGVHTVAQKETMFSIARQYGITVSQLKEWNNLQGSELSIGQTLFVSQPAKGTTVPTRENTTVTTTSGAPVTTSTPPTTVTPPKEQPQTPTTSSQTPQTTTSTQPTTQTIRISEATKNTDEILETGLAELIEGTEGNRKYLALHSTAPVGTILKIRNEMNNREVFVRVMGKLPDAAKAEKVVIRISRSAYDRLGAIDPKFRVQVTYYK